MLYNLTGILSSEEKVEKLTVPYDNETVSNGLDSYKILEKSDLALTLAKWKQKVRFPWCVRSHVIAV